MLILLGVSQSDLSDVEQEVLRGVSRRLDSFDPGLAANPENAVRSWLYAICQRQAANLRRTRRRRDEVLFCNDELDASPSAAENTEQKLIAEENKRLLFELLDTLEPLRRRVVIAYELEGLSMNEIAEGEQIPVNTAWNRLRLGREDLRQAWSRREKKQQARGIGVPVPPLEALIVQGMIDHWRVGPAARGALGAPGRSGFKVSTKTFMNLPIVKAVAVSGGLLAAGATVPGPEAALGAPSRETSASYVAASAQSSPVSVPEPAAEPTVATQAGSNTVRMQPSASPSVSAELSVQAAAVPNGKSGPSKPVGEPEPQVVRSRISEELEQISKARVALDNGDTATARQALDTHRRLFGQGRLAGDREILYLRLLKFEKRNEEAIERSQTFVDTHPDSPASKTIARELERL